MPNSGSESFNDAKRLLQQFVLKPIAYCIEALQRLWQADGPSVLFLAIGSLMCAALITWAKGDSVRRGKVYSATVCFDRSPSVMPNTPIRMKGVQIGQVADVQAKLDHAEVTMNINDASIVIPRTSQLVMTESGMFVVDPYVDIIVPPTVHAADYSAYDPFDLTGVSRQHIVCSGDVIYGSQGGSFDDMVRIVTRISRGDKEEELRSKWMEKQAAKRLAKPAAASGR